MTRWEIGSRFHWVSFEPEGQRGRCPWEEHESRLMGSGRDALRVAIETGRYRRLWVPSYFTQEVVAALDTMGVPVACYRDSPLQDGPDLTDVRLEPGDAVIVVNYFGLRAGPPSISDDGVDVIEDHTHAPCSDWALGSEARFCVASLHKSLPLADGGVVWSPRDEPLPATPPVRPASMRASFEKLSGMILKRLYLSGHSVDKAEFRRLLETGEAALFGKEPSAITDLSRELLSRFPLATWGVRRQENLEAFAERFPEGGGARLHRPANTAAVPFSAVIEFDSAELRDRIHARMCAAGVYASTLWPLDRPRLPGVPDAHRDLARRLLSLPVDMRYGPADLERAAAIIADALAEG